MSVLDLDFYKLTMLQFIWKHYADMQVTFRLHSRKQDLADIVDPYDLSNRALDYADGWLNSPELTWLREQGIFEEAFIRDLANLLARGMPIPSIKPNGNVSVTGDWFKVSLWETVILSAVSERYSRSHVEAPDQIKRHADIYAIGQSGARWADFGTRRRWSRGDHEYLIATLHQHGAGHGFIGTSNVALARGYGLTPVGTYAHELEMVLRNYHDTEFDTTRDVLTKWQEMYPRELRIALTDTYTTSAFLDDHGEFLLDNDWRGVRLDSGNPLYVGWRVTGWLEQHNVEWDVVFSDGLDADKIVELQDEFGGGEYNVNPLFGWGTGLTNPNSDLSLVMKAVESNGRQTYKTTDDRTKAIR